MTTTPEKLRELRVTESGTGTVVHTVNVTGRSDREVEKILRGMLINLNADRYYVADSADEEQTQ